MYGISDSKKWIENRLNLTHDRINRATCGNRFKTSLFVSMTQFSARRPFLPVNVIAANNCSIIATTQKEQFVVPANNELGVHDVINFTG